MGDYSKYNIVYRLQKWMDSVPGQTFLNYAYSWGASIVIAGTLFTLTHLPGAKLMIFLGMGTEIVVFFLSAFDRPFDKTADGRELPTHVTEEYLETGKIEYQDKNVAASNMGASSSPIAGVEQFHRTSLLRPLGRTCRIQQLLLHQLLKLPDGCRVPNNHWRSRKQLLCPEIAFLGR